MEDKEKVIEEECVDVVPNPYPYIITKEQYEQMKNYKLTKEDIARRKEIQENAEKFKKQIKESNKKSENKQKEIDISK